MSSKFLQMTLHQTIKQSSPWFTATPQPLYNPVNHAKRPHGFAICFVTLLATPLFNQETFLREHCPEPLPKHRSSSRPNLITGVSPHPSSFVRGSCPHLREDDPPVHPVPSQPGARGGGVLPQPPTPNEMLPYIDFHLLNPDTLGGG